MKTIYQLAVSTIICFVPLIASGGNIPSNLHPRRDITGIWQGVLKVQGMELRIIFKVSRKTDGMLTATMDSPGQGAKNIPVEEVTFKNGNLRMEVRSARGIFEGKINEDFSAIEGNWKQSGMTLPLVLKHIKKVQEAKRLQEPKKPYPYKEEEVAYENKKAGVKLAGTLTLPSGKGPFPAVLLITGSGAEDRNETVFGHHPFLVLADYLTRRGIAVLRVDDRGIGGSTGNTFQSTSEDFAGDVLAGIRYLKSRKEVNLKQIGLIGHSEGGIIAPMVAAQSSDIAFIVLMAGPGIPGDSILLLQSAAISRVSGAGEKEIKKNNGLQRRIYDVVKNEKDDKIAEKRLKKIMKNAVAKLSKKEKASMSEKDIEKNINGEIKRVLTPWFRFFLTYNPRPTLMKVKCPVLAINGEKDLQVPPEENLDAIKKALKKGGNKHFTVKELPGLNHLFQTANTGLPSEYAKIEETISPSALKIIGNWILKQTQGK